MNASSDAARTSRASPPIATPSAANATAAKASASSHAGVRLQPRSRNATSTASITAASAHAHRPARPIFSASSPLRDTSPRTSRPNAFSSRSSASIPAASSSVTNISEITTATSTPKTSSDALGAADRPLLHPHGAADRGEDRLRDVEVVGGEAREARDLAQRRARARVGRQAGDRRVDDPLRVAEPEDLDLADERQRQRAADDDQVQVAGGLLEDLVRERLVRVGQRGVDRRLDVALLERVVGACSRPRPRAGRRRRAPASPAAARSRRPGSRARRAPRRSGPSRSPPRACRRGSARRRRTARTRTSWRRAPRRRGRSSPRPAGRGWRTRRAAWTGRTRARRRPAARRRAGRGRAARPAAASGAGSGGP